MKFHFVIVMLLIAASSSAQERLEPVGSLYQFMNRPYAVSIYGDYVYIGTVQSGVFVLDISDRANPFVTDYIDKRGRLQVAADSVLILNDENDVFIYDITNPAVPNYLSTVRCGGEDIYDIAYSDNLIAVQSQTWVVYGDWWSDYELFIDCIDLTDAENPVRFHPGVLGNNLEISNSILYYNAWHDHSISVCDLSNPENPVELPNTDFDAAPFGVYDAGNILFASRFLIDTTDPENLEVISEIDTLYRGRFTFVDSLIFIHNYEESEITVLNAVEPDSLVIWSEFETQNPVRGIGFQNNTFVSASNAETVEIYDLSDPENMSEIGIWTDRGGISLLSVENGLLFACGVDSIMYILDISDPNNLRELSQISVNSEIDKIIIDGGFAFLLIHDEGIHIFNVTNPSQPERISTIDGNFFDFRVYGDDLYYSQAGAIFHYDIRDRSRPELIRRVIQFRERGENISFHVENEFVYLTYVRIIEGQHFIYGVYGFVIVDISDSDNPEVVSSTQLTMPDETYEYSYRLVEFINNKAFISSRGRLQVYSTLDREEPELVANFDGVNRFQGMSISNNLVLVSDYNELLVFDCTELLDAPPVQSRPLPAMMSLSAYPNPFNSTVTISVDLSPTMPISLQVFDLSGRLVETLVENTQFTGKHDLVWNSGNVGSGTYLLKLETDDGDVRTRSVTLLK